MLLWVINSLWCFTTLSWILQSIPLPSLTTHHCISTRQVPGLNKTRSFPLPKCIMLLRLASTRDLFPAELWCVGLEWPILSSPFAQFWTLGTCLLTWKLLWLCQRWLSLCPCFLASLCGIYIWCNTCYNYFQICCPYRFPTLSDAFSGNLISFSE